MDLKSDKSLSPFAAPAEPRSSFRQALPQILAVCVKNVLLLGFGMTLGFPTILIPSLSNKDPNEPFQLGQEAISWIGSINLICVPVGCLMSGAITQPIGRKRAMQFVNIPFLAAWLLFHFSTEVWQIFLALALTGLTGGLLEAPTLTYVAEITQPSLRGILSSTSGIAVVGGVLIQFLLGTFLHWRTVVLVCCMANVASFTLLFLLPESPHWLILKNRLEEAKLSIAWLRGWATVEEIEPEFRELYEHISKNARSSHHTILDELKLFTKRSFIWPYLLVSFAFFLTHYTGTTPLQVFAVKIFSSLHSPIDEYYATILMGVGELIGCILSTCIVHVIGKRKINFCSLVGCGCCFFGAATYAYLNGVNSLGGTEPGENKTTSWVPMLLLVGTTFFTHFGIRLLPWLLIGEVFSNDIRAPASGISGATSYVFGFIANKSFLWMISVITLPGTFWFYSGMCLFGLIVLYYVLPETEGKTLFEITEHFANNSKLTNKVTRHNNKPKSNGEDNAAYSTDDTRVLTYVAEITQPSLRGILSSTSSVAVIGGVLIQFLLGTFFHWKTVALISCSVPIISGSLLFFVPETPHWLIMKNRHLDARTSLAWLRGWLPLSEIEGEFKDMVQRITKSSDENPHKNWRLYVQKSFLWPYSIVAFAFFLGHFSGMTTLQTYAVKIFSSLQAPIDKYYATIILGCAEVCGCLVATLLVHSLGKRIMTFSSLLGCGSCFFLVALYAYLNRILDLEPRLETDPLQNTWIPTSLLIGAAFFTHMGIRILPWMLIGEVYSNETRATGSGLSGAMSYIFGFASNKVFLKMVSFLSLPFTFWLYSGVCIGGFVICYFVLPETEGKTLFEIVDHFAGNVKLDNSVHNAKYRRKLRKRMDGVVNTNFTEDDNSKL